LGTSTWKTSFDVVVASCKKYLFHKGSAPFYVYDDTQSNHKSAKIVNVNQLYSHFV
jgi:hypothetical protein